MNDGEDSTVVVQTTNIEISRLHLAMDGRIPFYEAQGEVVILCTASTTEVRSMDNVMTLASGQVLYLSQAKPFSLEPTQESSLLIVTVFGPRDSLLATLLGQTIWRDFIMALASTGLEQGYKKTDGCSSQPSAAI